MDDFSLLKIKGHKSGVQKFFVDSNSNFRSTKDITIFYICICFTLLLIILKITTAKIMELKDFRPSDKK